MTIFLKKRMPVEEWSKVQDRIGALHLALNGPHDLMMFSAETDEVGKQDIYLGLPDAITAGPFSGFETIARSDLPDFLCTLVAREDGFAERFPDIAGKRRTRYGA